MTLLYILVNGEPRPATGEQWRWWWSTGDRQVALTEVGPYLVSTIFLGIDMSAGQGPPVLYETAVFGPLGEEGMRGSTDMDRHSTREEALAGHTRMVERWSVAWIDLPAAVEEP